MKVITYVIILLWSFSAFSQANTLEDFQKANTAYNNGQYESSIQNYESIKDQGLESSELFYNLANAYFKSGQIGKSILNYEKAVLLSPNDKNIKNNLSIAREAVDTDIIEIPDFLPLRMWKAFCKSLSPLLWILVQLLFGILLIYSVFLWRLKTNSGKKERGFYLTFVSIIMIIFSFFAGQTSHKLLHEKSSGVIIQNAILKSAPDNRSDDIQNLSEGVKIIIQEKIDDWYKVNLMNKEEGYIEGKLLEVI